MIRHLVSCTLLVLAGLCSVGLGAESWGDNKLPVTDGLEAWYDGATIAKQPKSLDGPFVNSWPDASGKGRVARTQRFDERPQVLSESVGNRTFSSVRFDGVDDHFIIEGPGETKELTISFVIRPRSNAGVFRGIAAGAAKAQNDYVTGFNIDLGFLGSPDWNFLNVEAAGAGGVQNLTDGPRPFGQFHLVTIQFDPAGRVRSFIDGKPVGERPRAKSKLHLDQLVLGARLYRNEPGPAYIQGFGESDLAEMLIYGRSLTDSERAEVEQYLNEKYASLLTAKFEAALPFQMLMPGFQVRELPLTVTNINDLAYDDKGRLWLLGYDGRIHFAIDKDGDGLEETLTTYWDKPTIRGPISMLVRPEGIYVGSVGKISRIEDRDQDGKGDYESIVATDWEAPRNYSGGVDCMGIAFDRENNLYFALGCSDFTNAYLVKDGKSDFTLKSQRGSVIRQTRDGKRSTVATGVRFGVAMAFNRLGDLFVTDQEGETWLPGGNPLDELIHVEFGKHYGFPPRHPQHLPDVFDEPATASYGPQHQSTCGLTFNEASKDHASFGPSFWEGDALISGYSRGKIWRTKLAKSSTGFVSHTDLIASARMLIVDAIVSPKGDLVVSAHSGQPDWGRGPTGPGTLYKVTYEKKEVPQPVLAWAASPVEVRVAFDRPIETDWIKDASIEFGAHVRAGDRFEFHRPGYESVRRQTLSPKYPLRVREIRVDADGRTLVLATDSHSVQARYALTLNIESADAAPKETIDLDYSLSGIEVRSLDESKTAKVEGWLPHLDPTVNKQLTTGSDIVDRVASRVESSKKRSLRTILQPWIGEGELVVTSSSPFQLEADKKQLEIVKDKEGRWSSTVSLTKATLIEIDCDGAEIPSDLTISFLPNRDPKPRPVPLEAFRLPWSSDKEAPREPAVVAAPEVVEGDWYRGKKLFYSSDAQCSACHKKGTEGGTIGPDLSNLNHRDVGSVRRDIVEPSAAINPDFVPLTVLLTNGEVVSGLVRPKGKDQLIIFDSTAKERVVESADVDEFKSGQVSIMPTGYGDKLGAVAMRDLLTFLTQPEPKPPASAEGKLPPLRKKSEVEALLAAVPYDSTLPLRPLNIVLVAGPKDHDPGEHDYPIWQRRWKELLAKSPNVRVSTAFGWPEQSHFDLADVMLFYCWNHDWTREKYDQFAHYFARGGGLVMIHAASIADKEPAALAEWTGLAYHFGPSKFRHGPISLEITKHDSPITRGLRKVEFLDESYWGTTGEPSRVTVLAASNEESQARPILWTYEREQGRTFVSVMGHYNWTFDDPIFRTMLLRGMAWAARENEGRFNAMVTDGVHFKE